MITQEIKELQRMIKQRKDNLRLAGNTFFLDEKTILSYPREDGDNRYPLDMDGYTAWTYSSGYIHVREGGFYSLAWRQDGEDPDVDFFGGFENGKGGYEVFSLLGIPVDPPESKIQRYTVFTPTATYYFTEYKQVEFCVRVHVAKERTVYFTIHVENKSEERRTVLLSTYLDPFLRKQRLKDYDDRWGEETHIVDSLSNGLKSAISFEKGKNVHSLIQSTMDSVPLAYETTTSRDDYVGGKNRNLGNNAALAQGSFSKGAPHCFGTHNSAFGDIRVIMLKSGEPSRTDIRFKVFPGEIPPFEMEHKLIPSEIDSELKNQELLRAKSDNRLKITFGKADDPQINNEAFNCFLQFVKRQTEFCSFAKYYAWAEHLGIRDVWQQLEPTMLWKTEEFRDRALLLLSTTDRSGRSARQIGLPIMNFPAGFDLRQYIDQGVWILATLNFYLKYSGDTAFFHEQCGYYEYPKGKHYIVEGGVLPCVEKDSVADHMIRILDYLLSKRDPYTGCIRILHGDWNDPLHITSLPNDEKEDYGNAVSVMASMQVYSNLCDVVEVLQVVDSVRYADKIRLYRQERKKLGEDILREAVVTDDAGNMRILHGWGDQKSFLIGSFCDNDGKNRTSLIVQAFFVLSGLIDIAPQYKSNILDSVRHLDSQFGFKTFDAPFDPSFKGVTGITNCVPGTLENATTYIHSATFATYALYQIGESEFAWEQFKKLIPITHQFTSHSPFVMSNAYMENDYFGIDGESVNDWMTGSATVILKMVISSLCGYQPKTDGLKIAPARYIPFEDFVMTVESPKATVKIRYCKSSGGKRIFTVNGQEYPTEFDEKIGAEALWLSENHIDGVIDILITD